MLASHDSSPKTKDMSWLRRGTMIILKVAQMLTKILVLEFKLNLSSEQQQIIERWMSGLKSVWNRALKQLINFHQYSWINKEECIDENGKKKNTYILSPRCPIWSFYTYHLDDFGGIIRDRAPKKGIKLDAPYCPLKKDLRDARGFQDFYIKNDTYFGLQETIKSDRVKDAPWIQEIPYKLRSGTIKDLSVSWNEYKKSFKKTDTSLVFRGRPRFKTRRDKITTITHPNPKDSVLPEGDILKGFPKLGDLKIKGLAKRWKDDYGGIPPISVIRIFKRGSKWYIQLTGEFYQKAIKECDRVSQPNSRQVFRSMEARMKRTRRRIEHKRLKRLVIWLQSATAEEIKQKCQTIGEARLKKIVAKPPKTIKDFNALIGRVDEGKLLSNKEARILKAKQDVSKKEAKLLARIVTLHDKTRRQRKLVDSRL